MGAVPEAIAEEKLHAVEENGEELQQEEQQQDPAGDDEVPSSVDEVADEIGDQDRAEDGVLDDAAPSQERDDDENSSENSVSSAVKAPIVGGATPSEATSEWPEQGFASSDPPRAAPAVATTTKTVSTHYLVKIPRRVDNLGELRSVTDIQVKDKIEKRNAIVSTLQQKRAQRAELLETISEPQRELALIRADIKEKIEEQRQPLFLELNKARELPSSQDSSVCNTEEDLDGKLADLERQMQQHDRPLSLRDEKRIVREIQALKSTRGQVIVNSSFLATKEDALQGCQSRLKAVNAEIDALMARRNAISKKIKPVTDKSFILGQEISNLVSRKKELDDKIQGVFTERREISSQEYAKNNDFFQNRRDISTAKQLAFNQDKAGLEEFASAQVERVMTLWNNDNLFRLGYIKDNLRSTIRRLGTPDGRSLGPNEEPYELPKDDVPAPPAPTPVLERESKPTSEVKVHLKSTAKSKETKEGTSKAKEQISRTKEDIFEKDTVDAVQATPEAQHAPEPEDELALLEQERERRRVTEMEKAREADMRKKRLAEKKQAKAQARLEKEQQRKEKEKEKKQRKKAGNVTNEEEEADRSVEEEKVPEAVVASENGEKASPEEKKASRRGKTKSSSKSQGSSAVKLQIKRKRSFQRQLYDHWQLIAAAFGLTVVILVATTMFVRV